MATGRASTHFRFSKLHGAAALAVGLALTLAPAPAHGAVLGTLTQLPAPNNCIQQSAGGTECGVQGVAGINNPTGIAVSPDGKNVYVAAENSDAIAEFARSADGSLTPLSGSNACLGEHDWSTECGTNLGDGLYLPRAIIVSPDGKNVYVAAEETGSGTTTVGAIAEFTRNSDGSLTQLPGADNCIEEQGGTGCGTTTGQGITDPTHLAISPDGQNVYVSDGGGGGSATQEAYAGAVAEFSRDSGTGALSQLAGPNACIESDSPGRAECATVGQGLRNADSVMVSADGKSVYVGSPSQNAIAEFMRDPVTGALTQLPAPNNCIQASDTGNYGGIGVECGNLTGIVHAPQALAGSPDAESVYSPGYVSDDVGDGLSLIAELSRDPLTGALSELPAPHDCLQEHGTSEPVCGDQSGVGVWLPTDIEVSPDGHNAYVTSMGSDQVPYSGAILELARNSDGSLTQLAAPNDCIEEVQNVAPECGSRNGTGLLAPQALAVSADGASLYTVGFDGANAAQSTIAEFARFTGAPATAPQPAQSQGSQPQSAPAPAAQPAATQPKAKAQTAKHHRKKRKGTKAVKKRRARRHRRAPAFTG